MKNKKQFKEFYNELKENNSEIKEIYDNAIKEKNFSNGIKLISCLIIDFLIVSFILNHVSIDKYGFIIFLVLFVPIIVVDILICGILYVFLGKKRREYKQKFKRIIVNNLISNFYDDAEYFPENQMPKQIYDEANYNEYYNRYYSDDYLEGKINNLYNIGMGEVHTVHEEKHRDSDGHIHTTRTTKFHGIFVKIVIDKSIKSILKIQRNGKYTFNKRKLEMDSRRV